MKTAISVPDHIFSAADALAGRLGVSRSELYATAMAEFLAKHTDREITARLNDVYATERGALDPRFRQAQRQSLNDAEW